MLSEEARDPALPVSIPVVPLVYARFVTNHPRFWNPHFLTLKIGKLDLAVPSLPVHQLCSLIVQLLSRVWLFVTSWTAARQAFLSFTISQSLLKLMSTESVMPSNHTSLSGPLFLLPPIFPSIRVFSNELVLYIRWPKYWNFSFSISPSSEYSGLISFRTDWFDLLAVQGILKSLLQQHRLKASVRWCSAFFTVQLSHPYMSTGKTIALTRWIFVGKVMSLFFNTRLGWP